MSTQIYKPRLINQILTDRLALNISLSLSNTLPILYDSTSVLHIQIENVYFN